MVKQTSIRQIVCERFRKENRFKKAHYNVSEAIYSVISEITVRLFCEKLKEEPNDAYNKLLNKFNEHYHNYFHSLEACLIKDRDITLYQSICLAFGNSLTKEKKKEIYDYCDGFYLDLIHMKHLQ